MDKNIQLAAEFSKYFDVGLAISDEQKKAVYKLRYSVYGEEFGYESVENSPDGLEYDEFEGRSLHCVVTHKKTNMAAGCVRVVFGDHGELIPLEKYCPDSLYDSYIDKMNIDRSSICEISRLAVHSAFRRRQGEMRTRFGQIDVIDESPEEHRTYPMITMVMFLALIALGELSGKEGGFAMMEPFLPRLLRKAGFDFVKVGKNVDYHGMRAPFYARTDLARKSMHPSLHPLYNRILGQIGGEYKSLVASGAQFLSCEQIEKHRLTAA